MHRLEFGLLSVIILNLILHVFWGLLGVGKFSSVLAVIVFLYWAINYKPYLGKHKKTDKRLLLPILLIIGNIGLIAVVLYPYIGTIKIDNFTSLTLSSVTDMFKHSYLVTSIKTFGIPPLHPYFPEAKFSYYYGYYLIPSLFSYFWPQLQHYFLYAYILFTDLISLGIIYLIIVRVINNKYLQWLAMALMVFGMGWDVWPMFLDGRLKGPDLIEMWSISNRLGLRVDNTYVSLLWTPQHFLAAVSGAYLLFRLWFNKTSFWYLAAIFSFVCLSSAFVALALAFMIFLFFLTKPFCRKIIVKTTLFSIILLIPYLISVAQKGGELFQFYKLKPFTFVENSKSINYLFTLFSEYGLLFFLLPLLAFVLIKKIKTKYVVGIYGAVYIPLIITWFVQSKGYNDFALRGVILSQFLVIIVFIKAIEYVSNRWLKGILILLIFVNLTISTPGFLFEYASRWKTRQVLDPYASELIIELRKIGNNFVLAAAGKDEWIYKIPPLGFKPIYTADLYDSGGYIVQDPENTFGNYETREKDIYFRANVESSLNDLIDVRNKHFLELENFLSDYNYDWVIFDNRMGVKDGKNFWVGFFNEIEAERWEITPTFTAYNRLDLINKLKINKVTIDDSRKKSFEVSDNVVDLPEGKWFVTSCNSLDRDSNLRFEPENGYIVFESQVRTGACVGNVFYLKESGKQKLIGYPEKEVFLFPVGLE